MSPSLQSASLILLCCFLLVSTTSAFNITRLLGRYPDFGNFNDLLSKSGLVRDINSRRTITILALSNGAVGGLSGKPEELQKAILSNHVVLDYYDIVKLRKVKNRTIITTLYQTTGVASRGNGFVLVSHTSDGGIVFGSAVKDSPQEAKLVGSVASQPYNISVLSVSQPIVAPGNEGDFKVYASSPTASAPAPHGHKKKASSPAEAPSPSDDDDDDNFDAPSPADDDNASDAADAPADADAPSPDADGDADADDAKDAPPKSSAGKLSAAFSFGLAVMLATFLALFH